MTIFSARFRHLVLASAGLAIASTAISSPATAEEVWDTSSGKACFEKWIGAYQSQLNARKGFSQYESGKPYSITKYGQMGFKGMTDAGKAPEGWAKKYNENRYKYLWLPDATDFNSNASYLIMRGQIFPGLGVRIFVRNCLAENGIKVADNGTQTGGPPAKTAVAPPPVLTPRKKPAPSAPIEIKPAPKAKIAERPPAPSAQPPAAAPKTRPAAPPENQSPQRQPDAPDQAEKPPVKAAPAKTGKKAAISSDALRVSGFYSFLTRRPNAALCKAACDAHFECRSWTYVSPGTINHPTSGTCWLKREVALTPPALCCTSGEAK